jgi:CubicO group peptidase (beta-lactamase class C family)
MTKPERSVQDYLDRLTQKQKIPGIQYLMLDAQDIRFEYYGGQRNIGAQLPVTPTTTFMASSSSKVPTAAAILQLVEQGKLELDAPLSRYYPDHPYGDQVTIRRLLNQSSGIPNPLPLKWIHSAEIHQSFDQAAALKTVLNKHPKLAFPPGDKYAYSNISYWLLGAVIEQVSGQSYCAYMRQHVFTPLGAGPEELSCLIPDPAQHAQGYQKKYSLLGLFLYLMMDKALLAETEAGRFRIRPVYMNGTAYGGLIGTARGFARFLQDQLRTTSILFDAGAKTLFYAQQYNNRGEVIETTLGWHRGHIANVPYYGKPGGGPGFRSNIRIYPDQTLATVWFINETGVSESAINAFTDELDRQFLGI